MNKSKARSKKSTSSSSSSKIHDSDIQLQTVFDTVIDGIIIIDEKGTVETLNKAAEDIFGYAAIEVIGQNVKMLMPEPYQSEHDGYLHSYLTSGKAKVIGIGREVIGRRKDGSTFPMELSVSEMSVTGRRMFTGLVRNISERKQAEQEIRDSAARTRAIVDTVVDGIITIDKKGIVENFNPAAEKIFGYAASEVISQNVKMLMPEPYQSEHDGYLHSYLTSGEAKVIGIGREVIGRRKDGSTFPMELAVSEMQVGGKRMFTGIVRDISERKLAEEKLLLTKFTLDNAADCIYWIKPDSHLAYVNKSSCQLLGYSNEELLSLSISDINPDYTKEIWDARWEKIKKEKALFYETHHQSKAGHIIPIEVWANYIEFAGKEYACTIVRDITDRKQADKMKREFVSTVSHELRTPLTSIKGSLGLIEAGVAGDLPDNMKKLLNIAYNNSDRLVRLINDILDIEKIEAGKMDFHMAPIDLGKLLSQALDANKGFANEHNVHCVLKNGLSDAMVYADHDRLMQVITNLLSNAVKFSPEGSNVELSLSTHEDNYRVTVTDHGPGVPNEFLDRIFSKFSQADSSDTRAEGGTGLGLNIAKAIIEEHKGSINFETELGKGSTFYFLLPQYKTSNHASTELTIGNTTHPRILIVEDEIDTATLLRMMLKEEGIETDIAHSITSAKTLLENHTYDAMTLDLVLPEKNGLSLMKELRSNPKYENLPIIVISAIAKEGQNELNGDAIGVIDWMEKPIDKERLSRALLKAVGSSSNGKPRILHVEDDQDILDIVQSLIGDLAEVWTVKTLKKSKQLLQRESFDLVILDLTLPDGNGEELLPLLKNEQGNSTPVIVFSAKDIAEQLPESIESILVKSRTTNKLLLETILSTIQTVKPK